MANSAKYLKAISSKKVVAKATTSGEVRIVFQPKEVSKKEYEQPKSISLGRTPVNLLGRKNITLEDVKRSNLNRLVSRGVVALEL